MNWLKIAENYREDFIRISKELLQIPTLLDGYNPENKEAPFGEEIKRALDYMLALGNKDEFTVKNVDNYAAHIECGSGEEILGILGHLDVVPVSGKWTFPPFSATEHEGKIYARGAMDDKGPTVAAYLAMKMVRDQGIELTKRVRLILGCDEESGMRGLKHYLKQEKMPDIGFAPDAEFPLIYGEKGITTFNFKSEEESDLIASMEAGERYNVVPDICEVVVKKDVSKAFLAYLEEHDYVGQVEGNKYTIFGKNAHAAMPKLGVNAISLMVGFLKEVTDTNFVQFLDQYLTFDHYGTKMGIDTFDKEMKELTNNLSFIHYDGVHVNIGCNIRYPKNYDFSAGEVKMSEAANKHGLTYECKENSKPHYVSPDDELIQSLHKAYVKYSKDEKNPIFTIGGGTYARVLDKAVAFGALFPGEEELAHQVDEYLDIDKMIVATAIYAESIALLAGK